MTDTAHIPYAAIDVAVDAVMASRNLTSDGSRAWATHIVTTALTAAAPHIAIYLRQENERLRNDLADLRREAALRLSDAGRD